MLIFSLSSFTNTDKNLQSLEIEESVEISVEKEVDFARCRWRTCTYINGELQGCTDWTYGECIDGVPQK